jgi:hypothetical protein
MDVDNHDLELDRQLKPLQQLEEDIGSLSALRPTTNGQDVFGS